MEGIDMPADFKSFLNPCVIILFGVDSTQEAAGSAFVGSLPEAGEGSSWVGKVQES